MEGTEMVEYKLKELGSFVNGANFTPAQLGYGTRFVNLDDIFRSPVISCHDEYDYVKLANEDNYLLEDGDILFVRSSVKPSGVGLPSLFKSDYSERVVFCGF